MKEYTDYSLLSHNTFGIDANCHRFVEYATCDEAVAFARSFSEVDFPLLVIGGGSNLLLTGDYPATVVHSAIKGITPLGDDSGDRKLLECGSGEVWDDVVEYCVAHNLYGAENLSIIPGEVGASAVQNIGAYGVEVKDLIHSVEAVEIATGQVVTFSREECQYGYRQSRFKGEWRDQYLITHVTYSLSTFFIPHVGYGGVQAALQATAEAHGERYDEKKVTARDIRNAIIGIRNAKLPDPARYGNGGSFFMNPIVDAEKFAQLQALFPGMPYYETQSADGTCGYKIPAGWMIDQCGWKGKSFGRAGVHDKQALVLVNLGGATGSDILRLCRKVQEDVKAKFGIDIHPEVNIR